MCDFDNLWKYRDWLSVGTVYLAQLLKSIDYRINEWPQRFDRPKHMYRENACLLAASEFPLRLNFCRCSRLGRPGKYGYATGRCQIWRLCPYCSHKKRLELLRKFLPVFNRGNWWFLTMSPEEFCHIHGENIEAIISWWEGCRYALQKLIDFGFIDGALVFETISVHHYWPNALGLPHVHVLIIADEMTPETVRFLQATFSEYAGQKWDAGRKLWLPRTEVYGDEEDRKIEAPEPLWTEASTRTYRILELHDMAGVISYLCNPINFAEAYVGEWPQVDGNHCDASEFNENAIETINGWEAALLRRWGHRYMGALHHSRKDFVGVKKGPRESDAHIAKVAHMLRICGIEQMESDPCEYLGISIEEKHDM